MISKKAMTALMTRLTSNTRWMYFSSKTFFISDVFQNRKGACDRGIEMLMLNCHQFGRRTTATPQAEPNLNFRCWRKADIVRTTAIDPKCMDRLRFARGGVLAEVADMYPAC
jgi:hypothetical protein